MLQKRTLTGFVPRRGVAVYRGLNLSLERGVRMRGLHGAPVFVPFYVRNGLFFQSPDSMTSSFTVCLL